MISLSGDDKLAYVMLFATVLIGQSLVILSTSQEQSSYRDKVKIVDFYSSNNQTELDGGGVGCSSNLIFLR